jgi:hypothetical protein
MKDFSEFERLKIDQNIPIAISTIKAYTASFYSLLDNRIDTRIINTREDYEVLHIDDKNINLRSFSKSMMPISYLTEDSVIYFPGNDMHGDITSTMFDSTHPACGLKKDYLFKYDRKIIGEPLYDEKHCPILPPDGKEVLPVLIKLIAPNNGETEVIGQVLFQETPQQQHYVIDKDGKVDFVDVLKL